MILMTNLAKTSLYGSSHYKQKLLYILTKETYIAVLRYIVYRHVSHIHQWNQTEAGWDLLN